MPRWGHVAAAYALLGLLSLAACVLVRDGSPIVHPEPWLELPSPGREVYSVLCGLAFAAVVVAATRLAARWLAWARTLHGALRPLARGMSAATMAVLALFSAFGEEMLFRGLLQPAMGLVAQAVLFGALHQIGGPARWAWMAWAAGMGACLGALFQATGSLLGPIAAHALVNGLNLAFLKAHDPAPRPALGGLLGAPKPHARPPRGSLRLD